MAAAKVGEAYPVTFYVRLGTGAARTGLLPGAFVVDIIAPDNVASTTAAVAETVSGNGGYRFLIPAAFTTANGVGAYGWIARVVTTPVDGTGGEVLFEINDRDDLAVAIVLGHGQTQSDIADLNDPDAATVATAVRSELAVELARIDIPMSEAVITVGQSWVFQQDPINVRARGSIWLNVGGVRVNVPSTARLELSARTANGETVHWSQTDLLPDAGGNVTGGFVHEQAEAVVGDDVTAALALLGIVEGTLLSILATVTLSGFGGGTQSSEWVGATQDQEPIA